MKSIKEKAEEYTSDITNPVTNNAAFLAYKAGANYVLDEIEKIVKYDKDPRCIEFLKERIWRLKEK